MLEAEVTSFLSVHGQSLGTIATRISQLFEMACYGYVVKYYTVRNFQATAVNPAGANSFRYKLSAQGHPVNFSYFRVSKIIQRRGRTPSTTEFEIHHNLAVESALSKLVLVTPDVSVIRKSSLKTTNDPQLFPKVKYFCASEDVLTFFECKHHTGFPELMVGFIGFITELKPELMRAKGSTSQPKHLAPGLLVSGNASAHAKHVASTLQARYQINIFIDIFGRKSQLYSRQAISDRQLIGTAKRSATS